MATPTPRLMPAPTTPWQRWQALIGWLSLALITLIGVLAFAAPFVTLATTAPESERVTQTPLLTAAITGACLLVLFANLGPSLSSKSVALIGVLVAINAILRLVDTSFLLPGEFSPIFLLIMLVGYSFGARLGFLMGALTLLVSALITGGVGPWLPFQMLTCGWVGMTAGWLRPLRLLREERLGRRRVVLWLAVFGFGWGLLYGLIMNLYNWPFLTGGGWQPGLAAGAAVRAYVAFYLVQSLGMDMIRAIGNAALMLSVGVPLLTLFQRFQQRFAYHVVSSQPPG
jgi:energy-coupling factor transport system substrate-specific component